MDTIDFHLASLQSIALKLYRREFQAVINSIDAIYFQKNVFENNLYAKADQFIFQKDVTDMSYAQSLKLGYEALLREESEVFLLSVKIVIVKLFGNQRLTYFDPDGLLSLLDQIAGQKNLPLIPRETRVYPSFCDSFQEHFLPVGFWGEDIGTYRARSTKTEYKLDDSNEQAVLNRQYAKALQAGNIYHHIVETDHLINGAAGRPSADQFIHLIKLLTAYYATEKAPWSRELTMQLLAAFAGMRSFAQPQAFQENSIRLVSALLRTAVKRWVIRKDESHLQERLEAADFLANMYRLSKNCVYLDLIKDLLPSKEDLPPESGALLSWVDAQRSETD